MMTAAKLDVGLHDTPSRGRRERSWRIGATQGRFRGWTRFEVEQDEDWPIVSIDEVFHTRAKPYYYVFDFDGVISSETEERIYRMPPRKDERELLERLARHYAIESAGYDTRYLRHLVIQEILLEKEEPVEPGPLAEAAEELTAARRPFFILTARSGRAAVKRVLSFLDAHHIRPQELFFVGRAPKGRQLALARKSIGPGSLIYFDDSPRHTKNGRRQQMDNFETVFVTWPKEATQAAAQELYDSCLGWFSREYGLDLGVANGRFEGGGAEGRQVF
jgi:hypothetical protein